MAVRRIAHPSVDDRRAKGKQAQDRTPLSSHTGWAPSADRPDPVGLLMEIWYAHLDEDELLKGIRAAAKAPRKGKEAKAAKRARKTAQKTLAKAHTRDSLQALSKLGELVDGRYRIVSQPPIVVPARDLEATYGLSGEEIEQVVQEQFRAYRATLRHDQRHLLEQFQLVDVARKVVGVGSVGTRAFIALLQGRDQHDPLFLQVKEATASVLEGPLPRSRHRQHGERVVQGQRMLQAASDIFLGWTKGVQANRYYYYYYYYYYYWRQLRDMKGSAEVETMTPVGLSVYARICGWTWPGPTPAPATRWPSPPTWERATSSTGRSPTSPSTTPTRTSGTTRRSWARSVPAGCKPSQACETAAWRGEPHPTDGRKPGRQPSRSPSSRARVTA